MYNVNYAIKYSYFVLKPCFCCNNELFLMQIPNNRLKSLLVKLNIPGGYVLLVNQEKNDTIALMRL